MTSTSLSHWHRYSLELALMQKAEQDLRKVLQKPSDKLLITDPCHGDSVSLAFDYASTLMNLIDVDPYLNNEFAQFFHEMINDTSEFDEDAYPIYTYSLGLLVDGIQKYGEEPFKALQKEANQLMMGFSEIRILNLSQYMDYMFDCPGIKEKYGHQVEKFKTESKYTYLYHWDLSYYSSDDLVDFIKELPDFAKEYITFYQKIIETIQSLGGGNSYAYSRDSEKRAV